MKFTILPALALVLVLAGCTRDGEIIEDRDITGEWMVTGISSDRLYDWDGDGYRETDIFGTYSSCQRDIRLYFEDYGSGQSKQGCYASWQSMYWSFTNGGNTLNIDLPGDELNLDIIQHTQNSLRGQDRIYVDGTYMTVTYTLRRR